MADDHDQAVRLPESADADCQHGRDRSPRVYLDGTAVTQTASLPCRGLPILNGTKRPAASRLPVGDTAGCQPAPPACCSSAVKVPARCVRSTLSPAIAGRFWPYQYEALGRRISQTSWTWNMNRGTWVVTEELKFVYDGWRCIAELRASENALVRSYAWGLDLRGSL